MEGLRARTAPSTKYRADDVNELSELRDNASRASKLLKAMANKQRLLILCHLAEGEKSVGALREEIGLSQSALSQHLAILRRDKLVETRRSATTVNYSVASPEALALMETLYGLFCRQPASETPGQPAAETASFSGRAIQEGRDG
jgi:DNA-binding transcriptional ArsR family regulator